MIFDNSMIVYIIAIAVALLVLVGIGSFFARKRFAKLDQTKFKQRWDEIQGLCGSANTWPLAVINADKLLDEALKKSHYKGKTMGERLVSAQRDLSDNDAVWYGHKLRNKLVHEDYNKLRKRDVQKVLVGFRQALRDLGALK